MNCLYCDERIDRKTFKSAFIKEDILCPKCRRELGFKRRKKNLNDLEIEYFYDYKGIFSSMLLQYKECYDEALCKAFAYDIEDYISIRYHSYRICFVPSSVTKMNKRGFHPMKMILNDVRIKEVETVNMVEQLCQQGKDGDERKLMEHNFIYCGDTLDKVLIVDDVLTTGSTVRGMYNAMKPFCRKIRIMVLACA